MESSPNGRFHGWAVFSIFHSQPIKESSSALACQFLVFSYQQPKGKVDKEVVDRRQGTKNTARRTLQAFGRWA